MSLLEAVARLPVATLATSSALGRRRGGQSVGPRVVARARALRARAWYVYVYSDFGVRDRSQNHHFLIFNVIN